MNEDVDMNPKRAQTAARLMEQETLGLIALTSGVDLQDGEAMNNASIRLRDGAKMIVQRFGVAIGASVESYLGSETLVWWLRFNTDPPGGVHWILRVTPMSKDVGVLGFCQRFATERVAHLAPDSPWRSDEYWNMAIRFGEQQKQVQS